ncbi:MAG: zinc ribbon domain-containing protein [Oscillospiraceae bacterium]|nr:zinc ribbon domain-containing protein [Oscillospiraceae bacterium]
MENQRVCEKCGKEIKEGQNFCSGCGTAIKTTGFTAKDTKIITKKLPIIAIGTVFLIGIIILVIPKLMKSAYDYVQEGNFEKAYQIAEGNSTQDEVLQKWIDNCLENQDYEQAYKIAEGNSAQDEVLQKWVDSYLMAGNYEQAYSVTENNEELHNNVLMENMIAYIAKDIPDSLKTPDSFVLRDAWVNSKAKECVLYVSGTNGFGRTASSYWYYTYDTDKKSTPSILHYRI